MLTVKVPFKLSALTLSAPKAIFRFMQTKLIQASQLVTSCLTWNQYCSTFSYQNCITWEKETPEFEHGRVYFKQFGAERVNTEKRTHRHITKGDNYSNNNRPSNRLSALNWTAHDKYPELSTGWKCCELWNYRLQIFRHITYIS